MKAVSDILLQFLTPGLLMCERLKRKSRYEVVEFLWDARQLAFREGKSESFVVGKKKSWKKDQFQTSMSGRRGLVGYSWEFQLVLIQLL